MNKVSQMYLRAGTIAGSATFALSMGMGKALGASFGTGLDISDNQLTPEPNTTFTGLIKKISDSLLGIVLLLAGIVAVFYLIYSGFQYVTSAGNPEKVKTARAGIINAIIGIIIILSAFFIVRLAGGLAGDVQNQI